MFQPEFSLPVAIPLRFFRTAPLWLLLAALLALSLDTADWQHRFTPAMLALTHLLMLGFMGNIMIGALLQVSAVLAGVRAQHSHFWSCLLWLALQIGTALLAMGLWQMKPNYLQWAAAVLLASLGTLAIYLFLALRQSSTPPPARWAVLSLALTVLSGTLLVSLLSTGQPSLPLQDLLRAHIVFASIGWVLGLVMAVAFTVVPMFLVAPAWPSVLNRYLSLGLLGCVLISSVDNRALVLLMIPVLLWFLALAKILHQSQRRADPARVLWAWGGVNLLLATALIPWLDAASSILLSPTTAPILLAAYFVFAGLLPIVTAMLAKIIPFLLWLDYRLQVKSGGPLRHMGQLFPERWLRKLSILVISMGIFIIPFYLFAFKAIPLLLITFAISLSYCLEKAVRMQKKACHA